MQIRKHLARISSFIFVAAVLISCDKDDSLNVEPIFETGRLDTPTLTYTFLTATIDAKQDKEIRDRIEDYGFLWSAFAENSFDNPHSMVISHGKMEPNIGFSGFINNLSGNTRYYVRAYIKMNGQIYYANEIDFKTKPGTWKKLKNFPGKGFVNATTFSVNKLGYVIGSVNSKTQVWMYDPGSDSWTQKADAPFVVDSPTSFVINNIAYVYCNAIWEYNANSDTWLSKMNSFKEGFQRGCKGLSSFVFNNKAYIGSGLSNLNQNFIEWDPVTNSLNQLSYQVYKNPNRSYASAFVINDKCYLVGGKMFIYEKAQSVIEYDFANESSVYRGGFLNDRGYTNDRSEMISFVVKEKAYIGMGYGEFTILSGIDVGSQFDFYQYDSKTGSFIAQSYPAYVDEDIQISFLGRTGGISLVIDDRAFVGLGEFRKYNYKTETFDITPYNDFWEFIPE